MHCFHKPLVPGAVSFCAALVEQLISSPLQPNNTPQTGAGFFCSAANAKSLIGKTVASSFEPNPLHLLHAFLQQRTDSDHSPRVRNFMVSALDADVL